MLACLIGVVSAYVIGCGVHRVTLNLKANAHVRIIISWEELRLLKSCRLRLNNRRTESSAQQVVKHTTHGSGSSLLNWVLGDRSSLALEDVKEVSYTPA